MLAHLSGLIEANNQDGFDYYEYHGAVKELIQNGTADETAFVSVFTTAKTMGLTKPKLVASAKFYLSVIEKEKIAFETEAKNREKEDVIGKQKEIENTIKELEALKVKKENLEKQVSESKMKINVTAFAFNEAYTKIKAGIDEEVTKINTYLKDQKETK
jgi:phosphoenolpyruvate carboxylase